MTHPIVCSVVLLVACAVVHVPLMVLALDLVAWFVLLERSRFDRFRQVGLILGTLGLVVCSHLAQVALWAGALVRLGASDDYETAFYVSLGQYTSVGAGTTMMPAAWRALGPFETLTGLLMTGLSTGVAFAVVHRLMVVRLEHVGSRFVEELP